LETYNERGVFHKNVLYDFFSPLLKSCDIELNVNMQQFYERTGIEIHIFVTELNMFEPIDISYKTHPNWQVVDALYSSSTIPIIFSPIIQNDKCYIDGGFFNNYPVRKCLENNMDNKDSILGISIGQSLEHDQDNQFVTAESSFLDFTCVLLNRIIKNILFSTEDIGIIKYEFCFYTQVTTLQYIYKVVSSKEERKSLISMGAEKAMEYFQKWTLENEQ
jgi:predicted acylesterase/phospholipase RssA